MYQCSMAFSQMFPVSQFQKVALTEFKSEQILIKRTLLAKRFSEECTTNYPVPQIGNQTVREYHQQDQHYKLLCLPDIIKPYDLP